MSAELAVAGLNLLGGMMGSNAAQSAAREQAASAAAAEAGINRRFDLNRADQMPFMEGGQAANAQLLHLLSLKRKGETTRSNGDRNAIRQSLLGQYTSKGTGRTPLQYSGGGMDDAAFTGGYTQGTADSIDEQGLNAAIEAEMARQGTTTTPGEQEGFGDLSRRFTMADRDADPVYQSGLQFGLDQGTKAINQRAIAGGAFDSGETLKNLAKFTTDYGSTKANESYNRFNTDQGTRYNRLAGVSGAGQQAVNQVGAMGMSAANQAGELQTQAGNARAAGIVGGANAWGNAFQGINQGFENTQNRNSLKELIKSGYGKTGRSGTFGYYNDSNYD